MRETGTNGKAYAHASAESDCCERETRSFVPVLWQGIHEVQLFDVAYAQNASGCVNHISI